MNSKVQSIDHVKLLVSELEKRVDIQRVADRKQLMTIIKYQSKALKLQAIEYERRLSVLNHAHEEAVRVLNTYVAKATYEQDQKAFAELKGRVDVEFADRGGRSKGITTMFEISSGLALIISVAVAILTYVK